MALLEWLAIVEHELLLFAAVFFLIGAADELAMDLAWLWMRMTGKIRDWRIQRSAVVDRPLSGPCAVLIPAWREEDVIADTIRHALMSWPQRELRIYVGCYRNDTVTAEAILRGAQGDQRVRLVIHGRDGPTTKADCLNRLYEAMETDERRMGARYHMVLLHDAEDMVDAAALSLLDRALQDADFVQLPVLPEPQKASRWIGSHYCEEFAESHGKAMVVRDRLGAALPAAGVGCAFSRDMLGEIARIDGALAPFSVESLTEDYELGIKIKAAGGTARFLRVRGEDGRLVATRACFPARLDEAVRQKGRWVHGIALQGWDRLGWSGGLGEWWMRLRDRRGPMSALVLMVGYVLLLLSGGLTIDGGFGLERTWMSDPMLLNLLLLNLLSLGWRAAMRFAFTTREYGLAEGVRAVLRLPVTNIIAIMSARRAVFAYARTLAGGKPRWEKTPHHTHPAAILAESKAS